MHFWSEIIILVTRIRSGKNSWSACIGNYKFPFKNSSCFIALKKSIQNRSYSSLINTTFISKTPLSYISDVSNEKFRSAFSKMGRWIEEWQNIRTNLSRVMSSISPKSKWYKRSVIFSSVSNSSFKIDLTSEHWSVCFWNIWNV